MLNSQQIDTLTKIKEKTYTAIEYFESFNIEGLGRILDETWSLKKISNKNVSSKYIDKVYEIAKTAGAWGGKIMGAGSQGYMLFMCNPHSRKDVVKALQKEGVEEIDFSVDWNGLETRIV